MIVGAQITFQSQDDAGLFGLGGQALEDGNDGFDAGGVVSELALAEEGDEHQAHAHGPADGERLLEPGCGARIAFEGNAVEVAEAE